MSFLQTLRSASQFPVSKWANASKGTIIDGQHTARQNHHHVYAHTGTRRCVAARTFRLVSRVLDATSSQLRVPINAAASDIRRTRRRT